MASGQAVESTVVKHAGGRPSDYNQETTKEFCARIASGMSVPTICQDPEMPGLATVFKWFQRYPEFGEAYARARDIRAHARFESMDGVLDDMVAGKIDAQQARVIVDTVKWQCGKELPKVYGDYVGAPDRSTEINVAFAMPRQLPVSPDVTGVIDCQVEPAAIEPPREEK
jgi:hypothetical protein